MMLKCSGCGKTEEIVTREEFVERPVTSDDRWMVIRHSKESPDDVPKVRAVLCSKGSCLEQYAGPNHGLRFKDADQRVWFAVPPIEVFFAVDGELPDGCPTFKTKLVEILVNDDTLLSSPLP